MSVAMRRILGLPAEDPSGAARFLVEQGFDSLVVGVAEPLDNVRAAVDAGLAVWAYRAAFLVRGLTDEEAQPLLTRDVDGEPRVWFSSGCPNRRALRDAHISAIERLAQTRLFTGFMLDGIRFASPNADDAFFTCFCDACRAKAGVLGVDFERMRRDVAALRAWCRAAGAGGARGSALGGGTSRPLAQAAEALPAALARWPGVTDWLRFRAACVVEHVEQVRQAVNAWRAPDGTPFRLGAYVFTPSFARLVGQRYGQLAPLLDVISPMIYRINTGGDSGLVPEWAALASLGLLPAHEEFTAAGVGAEVSHARALLPQDKPALVPILRLADDLVADTTRAARAAGADGLDYFVFRSGEEAHIREAAKAAASPVE
jgi:hypothetical protein